MARRHLIIVGMMALCLVACNGNKATCFEHANLDVQNMWEEAVKQDGQNHYMSAAETYDRLLQKKLTKEQAREVHKAIGSMYMRMNRAAADGDTEAKKVVAMIKASRPDSEN